MARKKRSGGGVGQTIGSILVGFDQAVFRTLPPAEELVHHSRPDDPLPAGSAGELVIVFPKNPTHDLPALVLPEVLDEPGVPDERELSVQQEVAADPAD